MKSIYYKKLLEKFFQKLFYTSVIQDFCRETEKYTDKGMYRPLYCNMSWKVHKLVVKYKKYNV